MAELIFIIFIIVAVINASSKKEEAAKKNQNRYASTTNTVKRTYSSAEQPWEKAARENIEKAARRAGQFANKALNNLFEEESVSSPETDEMSAAEQIRVRRMEEKKTTILQRAMGNVAEHEEDVTLNTMEEEHDHSERVSEAVHHHPEDIIPDNMLGNISDLMIKGYEGALCFERDFVGEGMDMISRFTVPSEVPEFTSHVG